MTTSFDFKRDLLPHLLAVVVFFVITAAYFSPVLFEGKGLAQNDILQFKGGSKEIQDYRDNEDKQVLWTNSMFSGMPAYLISVTFPGNLFQSATKVLSLGLPHLVSNIFLTLVCAYILFVVMGMSTWLSIIGAIALAFTSYNIIILEAGHNTKSYAIAYAPLVLAGVIYTFRRNFWIGFALFTVALTLQLLANHMQITYYLMLMIVLYGIVEMVFAVKNNALAGFFKRVGILMVGALLAVGVNFGPLYTTLQYGKYSIRGKSELTPLDSEKGQGSGLDRDYAFNWSYGVSETITLLIPDYFGGSSTSELSEKSNTYQALQRMGVPPGQAKDIIKRMPTYWGDQPFTSGPVYVGAIICMLFVLGLFIADKKIRYWLLAATILSAMLAWGKNFETFNYLMFDYFPGYNKFRAVAMALVIAQIAMPILAVFALYRLLYTSTAPAPVLTKKLLWAVGITGGICVLAILLGGTASFSSSSDQYLAQQGFPIDAIQDDRASMLRTDAIRSLVFILLAGAVLYFYLRKSINATTAVLGVGLLILVDLWAVDKRYLDGDDFTKNAVQNHFQPTPADQMILQDKDLNYRVYNVQNPFNDARTSYFHKSIGGYHGAKMRRYQDLIERQLSKNNMKVLNMLNARYAITGQQDVPVQRIPGALGNAWFVEQVVPVNSPDEEIAALDNFEPATQAVVDVSKFPVQEKQYAKAGSEIKLTSYDPDHLVYEANAAQEGLVVFSEIYYKDGWNAYIDGNPAEHIRANYVLRALKVPAGKHKIEFKFEPEAYKLSNTVALISSILVIAVIIGAVVYAVRRKPEPKVIA